MPNQMNRCNKAGLYGAQTIFFYEYGLPYASIARDSGLKAISLNENEAEWHYLLARVLTYWQRTCGNYFECSEQEIQAAETAVRLGQKDNYKLHLAYIYHRLSKHHRSNTITKNTILDSGLKLIK